MQFSFSKIEKYLKCSWWYFLYYIDKSIPRPSTDNVATVAGTFVHDALEVFYGNVVNRSRPVLELLELNWLNHLLELDLLDVFEELKGIAADTTKLFERAKPGYRGLDAILDDKGKPFKSPQRSGPWAAAERALNLGARRAAVDAKAKATGHKIWTKVSLAVVFALTFAYLTGYVDTISQNNLQVLAQELPISSPQEKGKYKDEQGNDLPLSNVVYFPNGSMYTGYVDMIAQDPQGRLYIIDHKTSKEAPSMAKVQHWDQLLLYGWAHFQLWGRYPDFIAINSVQKGVMTIVKFDPALAEAAVKRKMSAIAGIEREVFIQASPSDYGSNCYNEYTKEPCEYLAHCHPAYHKSVVGGGTWAA